EGAIDNVLRHAITKLSHLHLVSHSEHALRVRQMGEADDTVHVVGAPGLDNLHRADLPDRHALEGVLGISLQRPLVVVTFHPTTLGGDPVSEVQALVTAMAQVSACFVITLPNNDTGAHDIRRALLAFAETRANAVAIEELGPASYFGLLRDADAVLGNSSSGLMEAPLFALPAVNVGERQRGRLRGANVIDVAADAEAIVTGLRRSLDPGFRAGLPRGASPYGDGKSAARIVEILAAWRPPQPPRKRFV